MYNIPLIFIIDPSLNTQFSKVLPVMSNENQIEDIHINAGILKKWQDLAHKHRQIPSLNLGSMKVEGYAKGCDQNVSDS